MAVEALGQFWTGDLLLLATRERVEGGIQRFGIRWFLPVLARFKAILAEVILVSMFIQLIATGDTADLSGGDRQGAGP